MEPQSDCTHPAKRDHQPALDRLLFPKEVFAAHAFEEIAMCRCNRFAMPDLDHDLDRHLRSENQREAADKIDHG